MARWSSLSAARSSVIRDEANDAFQAVFFVLARKAPSIADGDLLANWLYGVALRTARKARTRLARRCKHETAATDATICGRIHACRSTFPRRKQPFWPANKPKPFIARSTGSPGHFGCRSCSAISRALLSMRRPVAFAVRLARSAAGWRGPVKSSAVGSRRRGFALSAAAVASALSSRSAWASVSSSLCGMTVRAAIQFAGGQTAAGASSTLAMALAQEVLRSMLFAKLKLVALAFLCVGAAAAGAGFVAQGPVGRARKPDFESRRADFGELGSTELATRLSSPKSEVSRAGKPDPHQNATPEDAEPKPAPGRMFIVGRVLDPQGNPVPNAAVMTSVRNKAAADTVGLEALSPIVSGNVNADGSGRYRVDAPRTSSSRNDEFLAIALAPGFGVGWVAVDPDAEQPAADIRLQPEQVIHGRLFDVQGRPVQGVSVSVSAIQRIVFRDVPGVGARRRSGEGPYYWFGRKSDWPAWPIPVTTDVEGRFTVHGVGRGVVARLSIIDPRFALQQIMVETDGSPNSKSVTMALESAKIITGRVTYSDTGKPVVHARISVGATGEGRPGTRPTYFQADAEGRFRVNPSPGDRFHVSASPPAGKPYLAASRSMDWPKGAVEQSVDLALPQGVLMRGRVVEEGSNRPVAGAAVAFVPRRREDNSSSGGDGRSVAAADGSFEMAVSPNVGYLAVKAPSEDYVLRVIGNLQFFSGRPGGRCLYSHAFIPCEPKASGPSLELNVTLRRGITVAGRVVGPDDQPVADVWVLGRLALMPSPAAWNMWRGDYHREAFNGRFELHGLDPDAEVPVFFLEPKRALGATVQLSGKSAADGPITVRLAPCGTAKARLVDGSGKPIAGHGNEFMLSMTNTSGRKPARPDSAPANTVPTDGDYLVRINPVHYQKAPVSDAEGRIVFPALIPGASHRIVDTTARVTAGGTRAIRKEFTVKPGETLDLGDILIEKPGS